MLFDKLKGAKYFTKLDLSQGFHQLRLTPKDRAKSAITTRYGNFEWTVASLGMSNVPSVFSRVLGNVLWDYQDKFVINFMDDILIYSPDCESHVEHVQQVLNKLKEASLYANPENVLGVLQVSFIWGMKSQMKEFESQKRKSAHTITNWPTPQNVKELRSFLGLASYYIGNLSNSLRSLHNR